MNETDSPQQPGPSFEDPFSSEIDMAAASAAAQRLLNPSTPAQAPIFSDPNGPHTPDSHPVNTRWLPPQAEKTALEKDLHTAVNLNQELEDKTQVLTQVNAELYETAGNVWEENRRLKTENSTLKVLAEEARVDLLTGVYSRRGATDAYLSMRVAALSGHERRAGQPTSAQVLYIDIDDFGKVNHGPGKHDDGDAALKQFGVILKENIRQSDIAARWGGDEFVILLPGVTDARAYDIAEAILQEARESKNFPTTVSIGIGTIDFTKTLKETLIEANHAVHAAKDGGKDIIVRLDQLNQSIENS